MSKTVGDYILKEKIGKGSYADVYRGIHKVSRMSYAIKTIFKENLSDPKLLMGLESEIKIMREFKHVNIVQMHEYFSSEKNFYLVLELCEGGDLSKYIKKNKRLSERVAHSFLLQLAEGLSFLQEKNFIHRDLKPANVLLSEFSENATLKLADFGFARHLTVASLAQTRCGTPLYMAPEILESKDYDGKADIWSVGCIFYEMLVGVYPFRGANETDLLNNIKTKELTMPSDLQVSKASVDVLIKLLERSPQRRAAVDQLLVIARYLVQSTGGTARDAASHQASAVAAADVMSQSSSGIGFDPPSNPGMCGESIDCAKPRRTDAGEHGSEFSDNQVGLGSSGNAAPQAKPMDGGKVNGASAVSAIGSAIAFMFSPQQQQQPPLDGTSRSGVRDRISDGRSVSADGGPGYLTHQMSRYTAKDATPAGRPPISVTPKAAGVSPTVSSRVRPFASGLKHSGYERAVQGDSPAVTVTAADRGPALRAAAQSAEEEGFVMIDTSDDLPSSYQALAPLGHRRVRRSAEHPLDDGPAEPELNPERNATGDRDALLGVSCVNKLREHCLAARSVVAAADRQVFAVVKRQSGGSHSGGAVSAKTDSSFVDSDAADLDTSLVAFVLYTYALSLLRIVASPEDCPHPGLREVHSKLFSEILDRAQSCRSLIQRQLSQEDMASPFVAGSFQLPVAQEALLQLCAERLADAAIEELRNLPRAEKLYATSLDLYDAVLLSPSADAVQRAELEECRSRVVERLAGCRSQVADMDSLW